MKTILKLFVAVGILFHTAFAQVGWSVDPAHTNARFAVKHLGLAMIDGEFTSLEGSVDAKTADNFEGAKVNFSIDANSINTRVEARDTHLKSNDFFNVEKFPKLTFKNGVLKKGTNGQFTLIGDLTIRDVTKQVSFEVTQNNGIITDPWGMTRAGFTATTTINRLDYNVSYNDVLPSGIPAVATNVDIIVNVEVVKN